MISYSSGLLTALIDLLYALEPSFSAVDKSNPCMLAAVILVSNPTNLEGLNPSNPPWNGTINFLVERFIVDPPGVIVVSFVPAAFNEADGCCFSLLKLNATLLPTSLPALGIGFK